MTATDYLAYGVAIYYVAFCTEGMCWDVEASPHLDDSWYAAVTPQQQQQQPVPTGEYTEMVGWEDPPFWHYQGKFLMTLLGGNNFAGRTIREVELSSEDTCWFPESDYEEAHLTGTADWQVQSDNKYGYDSIGWRADAVHYYLGDTSFPFPPRAPCGFQAVQSMQISVPGGWAEYQVHNVEVQLEIQAGRYVVVTRHNKSGAQQVPD